MKIVRTHLESGLGDEREREVEKKVTCQEVGETKYFGKCNYFLVGSFFREGGLQLLGPLQPPPPFLLPPSPFPTRRFNTGPKRLVNGHLKMCPVPSLLLYVY